MFTSLRTSSLQLSEILPKVLASFNGVQPTSEFFGTVQAFSEWVHSNKQADTRSATWLTWEL